MVSRSSAQSAPASSFRDAVQELDDDRGFAGVPFLQKVEGALPQGP
jgi:hypothetical protein